MSSGVKKKNKKICRVFKSPSGHLKVIRNSSLEITTIRAYDPKVRAHVEFTWLKKHG